MTVPARILLASGNAHKLAELGEMLAPLGIEVVSPSVVTTRAQEPTDRLVPIDRPTPAAPAGVGREVLSETREGTFESIDDLREEIEMVANEREQLARRREESKDPEVAKALADEVERLRLRENQLRDALALRED